MHVSALRYANHKQIGDNVCVHDCIPVARSAHIEQQPVIPAAPKDQIGRLRETSNPDPGFLPVCFVHLKTQGLQGFEQFGEGGISVGAGGNGADVFSKEKHLQHVKPALTVSISRLGDDECKQDFHHLYCCRMKAFVIVAASILLVSIAVFASQQEDTAADSVARAFIQARDAAHLSKLARMGRNTFRGKVCKHDLRFASGLISTAQYQTADLGHLPEVAQRLAVHPDDGYRVTTRFGVGVCVGGQDQSGRTVYSVLIATYESRWNSFLRIFWE